MSAVSHKDDAEQIELSGGGQGGESGDHEQKKRGLEETLDLRRGQSGVESAEAIELRISMSYRQQMSGADFLRPGDEG